MTAAIAHQVGLELLGVVGVDVGVDGHGDLVGALGVRMGSKSAMRAHALAPTRRFAVRGSSRHGLTGTRAPDFVNA